MNSHSASALTLLAALAVADVAAAQQPIGPPLQLIPSRPPRAETAPLPPPVEVAPLTPLDRAGGGIMDVPAGGFGPAMWAESDGQQMTALVAALPVDAPSPAMRALLTRLLMSNAEPPAGETAGFLAARVKAAAALGLTEELFQLADANPAVLDDAAALNGVIDGLLLGGRLDDACAFAGDGHDQLESAQAQELMVLCRLAEDDLAAARLSIDVLNERQRGDAVFLAIADGAVEGTEPQLPDGAWRELADPRPALLTLLELAARPVATAALRIDDPGRLVVIAVNQATPGAVRLDAAERAAAAGALSPADLAALYTGVELPAEDVADAESIVLRDRGPLGRALLLQGAENAPTPDKARELRLYALDAAKANGAPLTTILALLETVPPLPEASAVAVDAAAAYAAAGEAERARAWLQIAAAGDLDADRAAMVRTWPLLVLAGLVEADADAAAAWLDAALVDEEVGVEAATTALAALTATGRIEDPVLWSRVAVGAERDEASLPAAAVWWRLPRAAAARRIGETVALGLVALGSAGPAGAHPVVLDLVLRTLRGVGLDADADRLAREAIWAAL